MEKPNLSYFMFQRHFQLYEGIDAKFVFKLAHPGQRPLIFHADSEHLANRYVYLLVKICYSENICFVHSGDLCAVIVFIHRLI